MQELIHIHSIVGPTHHYGGLADGNVASLQHKGMASSPNQAALQSLDKIKTLHEAGIPQYVLPPHERPNLAFLHEMGFSGTPEQVLKNAHDDAPELLRIACSSAAMWSANAATATAPGDSRDGRLHITPANLVSHPHRALEAPFTTKLLRLLFPNPHYFAIHDPLPAYMPDEGMANVLRFATNMDSHANYAFIHGPSHTGASVQSRQSKLAFRQLARRHLLFPERVRFYEQSSAAIAAGVFHNDVISFSGLGCLFSHEQAFTDPNAISHMNALYAYFNREQLRIFKVENSRLSLSEAVACYLFNSQCVPNPSGGLWLLAPEQCQSHPVASEIISEWKADPECPINKVSYHTLDQSMANGGGPACLRLPIILKSESLSSLNSAMRYCSEMDPLLRKIINDFYPETLHPSRDLFSPQLYESSIAALDKFSQVFELGSIYRFQGSL